MAKKHLNQIHLNALVNEAMAIEAQAAQDAGAVGYMARALAQATIPHSKKDGNEFVRKNGHFTLTIVAPSNIGLPYGSLPRLLLVWVATEAVRTRECTLIMGENLSDFMRQLDLMPTGGVKGDITRLREQIKRLFSCMIRYTYNGQPKSWQDGGFCFAYKSFLWWDEAKLDGLEGKGSKLIKLDDAEDTRPRVVLTQEFFKEITTRPAPVDLRAVKILKQSPMALDIYCWLTYRMSYLGKPTLIPWEALEMQFGSDYTRTRAFKEAFIGHLKAVHVVYPQARLDVTPLGLKLLPSPTHVGKRPR